MIMDSGAGRRGHINVLISGLLMIFVAILNSDVAEAQLKVGFYSQSCPQAEVITRNAVRQKISQTFVTIPGTLRLFYHDCMSSGCNAAIMIGNGGERDQVDNANVAGDGYDTIDKAKAAVEKACPGKVSCADIIAMAARDVVFLSGGPFWQVETGRKDSLTSRASDVNLAKPEDNLNQITANYARKGQFTLTDLVALSGAHTVGFTHCTRVLNRLYNFPSSNRVDPSLSPSFANQLKAQCPRNVDSSIATLLDQVSDRIFDNQYFKNLVLGQGVLQSDSLLFTDARTRQIVRNFATNQNSFFQAFTSAMLKVGRVNVLTGSQGKVRRVCSVL